MMKTLKIVAATVIAAAAQLAVAHGDDEHAKHHVYDAGKVEDTAFGREGDPKQVSRTIEVDMADSMRFSPANVTVHRGETVKFVIRNDGKLLHEMVLGSADALKEHAALMRKFPEMEHSDPNMAHVKPGGAGEIVWQFTRSGEFQFACLQPGHYEAGMLGQLHVDAGPMAEGEVRKVDKAQGKLTLRHGPITNLEMPGMTMVFRVADPKLLDTLKEGDKVRFSAERVNGAITVTGVEAVK